MNRDIHPVVFHSHTFNTSESNYDVHNKELLAIFEAFKKWQHYLEGTPAPVEVFTDHKNLVYFCESKVLSYCQARWSEFLSQFYLIIKFRPGRLGLKPDVLMHCWDIYDKREHHKKTNLQPMFSQNQLDIKTPMESLTLQVASTLDTNSPLANIKLAVTSDLLYAEYLKLRGDPNNPRWLVNNNSFFLYNRQIFIPESNDLHLQVLQARHDHQLAEHMGQSKTYHLVRCDYSWPKICKFVKDYVKTCSTCMHNKSRRYWPYGLLKQLPIPLQPWESIFMDFIEQLSKSLGYTDILVVVDRLTKQAIFIPTQRSIDAIRLAGIFLQDVFSKHRVPLHVTSNWESEFISKFFRALALSLDMQLHFTLEYYPEADSQTERTNQSLE